MARRRYYSSRKGSLTSVGHDLPTLKRLVEAIHRQFELDGYLQEAFGYWCSDEGQVVGTLGRDIEIAVLRLTKKANLWPLPDDLHHFSEEDLFDFIEFLFDHVSQPLEEGSHLHDYYDGGWHYTKFDKKAGQQRFLEELNPILEDYNPGYRLSDLGEIEELGEPGLNLLLDAPLPEADPEHVTERVSKAIQLFRRHHASLQDRRTAVRELADVLEFLKKQLKEVLTKKDESDLFNIANNFGIRHNNMDQKTHYDKAIWLSWMFYYYLATIHASLRLIEKSEARASP